MTIDESRRAVWEAMQRQRQRQLDMRFGSPPSGGGDGTGGVEARLAKLEADVQYIKADLGRLSAVPVELARAAERINHVPTKAELKIEIEQAVDRAGARTQRTVAIVGGFVTLAIALVNFVPRLL